ncbi:hypothetical protein ACFPRL_36340 [Pseudoclavibacter helvolus]
MASSKPSLASSDLTELSIRASYSFRVLVWHERSEHRRHSGQRVR